MYTVSLAALSTAVLNVYRRFTSLHVIATADRCIESTNQKIEKHCVAKSSFTYEWNKKKEK